MTGAGSHPTDLIHDRIDGRLDAAGRAALDAHLAGCESCRRELAALEWTRRTLAAGAADDTPAPGLDRLLAAPLDAVDVERSSAGAAPDAGARSSFRWRWWAAAAALVLVVAWIGPWRDSTHLPTLVAADLRAFATGTLQPEVSTADPIALEAQLQASALGFPVRVFDFGMMNITLAGGGVHRVAGARSALMAYRGADGTPIICQMYLGSTADLPPTSDERRHNDMDFFVYREREVTLVFWQEGGVVCVLAATGDSEAAVQLAFAKALKV